MIKPNEHILKLNLYYCDDVLSGLKSFEVRKNDRDFKVGDLINFVPVFNGSYCHHKVELLIYRIDYILYNFIGLKDGYVAFSIKKENEK